MASVYNCVVVYHGPSILHRRSRRSAGVCRHLAVVVAVAAVARTDRGANVVVWWTARWHGNRFADWCCRLFFLQTTSFKRGRGFCGRCAVGMYLEDYVVLWMFGHMRLN